MIANKNHSLHPQQRNLALIFERDVDEDLNKNVCMNYSQIIIPAKSLPFDDDNALLVALEQNMKTTQALKLQIWSN